MLDPDTREVRLYCHSKAREDREHGIEARFSTRLEAELKYLAEGLEKPRRVRDYARVIRY